MTRARRRIAIVGGTAAGPAAAAEASRTDPDADITMFEAGPDISWGVCELPMLLSGEIERADELIVFEPDQFKDRYGVQVETGTRVESIEAETLTLDVRSEDGQVSTRRFDAVVLATGTRAVIPDGLRTDAPNVTLLRSIGDARRIREQLRDHSVHHAVVVGGGYLGIEAAEALHIQGVRVTLLQRGDRLMGRVLGDELAHVLSDRLTRAGVNIRFETATGLDVRSDGRVQAVRTAAGEKIGCQAVILGAGVAPNSELARDAGLALGVADAVSVNERLATSAHGIWACGDCITQADPVTKRSIWVPLALPAYRSGHVAGRNAARRGRGKPATMKSVVPVYGLRVFDTEVAVVGSDREGLRAAGYEPVDVYASQVNRASLLEHDRIHMSLTADRSTGRLLGGRFVGGAGAALRANALSMAVRLGATADDLYDLDTVYTPRIAPMHDVLTVAGRQMQKALGRGGGRE
ncbi:MAG: FAD-dependent oxidoreductase [Rhodothermales bacterium]|nr:FAD-dependent oxidoreductase [Rhodothermales bacterium]